VQRLANLGWAVPPEHHRVDEPERMARLSASISAFQSAHGLSTTGEIDEATLSKIEELHGI
jgi:hypothetical protein